MLQVSDQFDILVARADHMHAKSNVAVLGAGRLEGGHLNAAWQYSFQVFHCEGPGESFLVEQAIERGRLIQNFSIGRLPHHVLVALPLLLNAGNGSVERMVARPRFLSLVMQRVQAKTEADGHQTDRKSTRLNSSHRCISYAVFCLK